MEGDTLLLITSYPQSTRDDETPPSCLLSTNDNHLPFMTKYHLLVDMCFILLQNVLVRVLRGVPARTPWCRVRHKRSD
jgi:hypothetical protein